MVPTAHEQKVKTVDELVAAFQRTKKAQSEQKKAAKQLTPVKK